MPEGHTLHRYAGQLRADLAGHPVCASSPQGRFADGAAAIDGHTVERVEAWGKHLFIGFDHDVAVHIHLALAGHLIEVAAAAPPGGTRLFLQGPNSPGWALIAPRVCELVTPEEQAAIVARLGPDPLRPRANKQEAVRRMRAHRGTVAAALLDQAAIAGVGNVFRAEVLYLHRVDPRTKASEISDETYLQMWATLVRLMRRGVQLGRIVTVDRGSARTPVERARYVYKQEHCLGCGAPVSTWTDTGRVVYACSAEQLGVDHKLL